MKNFILKLISVFLIGLFITAMITPVSAGKWSDLRTNVSPDRGYRNIIKIPLFQEMDSEYESAKIKILRKRLSEDFIFCTESNQVYLDDENQMLVGEYSNYSISIMNETGEIICPEIAYSVSDDDTLMIPAGLSLPGVDGMPGKVQQCLILASLDANSKTVISKAIMIWDEDTQNWVDSGKTNLTDFNQIQIHHIYRRETEEREGCLLPFDEWEITEDEVWQETIEKGWHFEMIDISEDETHLYVCVEIQDMQGLKYTLEPVSFIAPTGLPWLNIMYDDQGLVLVEQPFLQLQDDMILLSASVQNLTDQEATIHLDHLTINGRSFTNDAYTYGSGPNWGLISGEEAIIGPAYIFLDQLDGEDTIISITFDLNILNAENNESIGSIPVVLSGVWMIPTN